MAKPKFPITIQCLNDPTQDRTENHSSRYAQKKAYNHYKANLGPGYKVTKHAENFNEQV